MNPPSVIADFFLYRTETFSRAIRLTWATDPTGYSLSGQVLDRVNGTKLLDFGTTQVVLVNGVVSGTVSLTSAQVLSLPITGKTYDQWTDFAYKIDLTCPDGSVRRVACGRLRVAP